MGQARVLVGLTPDRPCTGFPAWIGSALAEPFPVDNVPAGIDHPRSLLCRFVSSWDGFIGVRSGMNRGGTPLIELICRLEVGMGDACRRPNL